MEDGNLGMSRQLVVSVVFLVSSVFSFPYGAQEASPGAFKAVGKFAEQGVTRSFIMTNSTNMLRMINAQYKLEENVWMSLHKMLLRS